MNSALSTGMPYWYAIHTKPKQEIRAESNLRAWHVETFAPKIRERRYNQFTGKATQITKPLFPRYIFARFAAGALLHKVSFTRGVQSVVCIDGWPTRVDDEIIEMIQSRKDEEGFIRIGEEFCCGDKVVITEGPLRNFMGVFDRKMKDEQRASILLSTVSYQNRVLIEVSALRKIS
ncbi:MAG TPA: transcription termination/antitermination NusG family protein [Pyrinomonadaceae bacterium]|jgi:transcriptional antiterminator RfaH|nr:transcription termination/antitermination NusG family protein [Pyrinomonadaceae bacterium]